jgi:hypothetical protein
VVADGVSWQTGQRARSLSVSRAVLQSWVNSVSSAALALAAASGNCFELAALVRTFVRRGRSVEGGNG